MILKKIDIYNFRSFLADHSIKFSEDTKKPITLFLGENGAGKTNLINAIYWSITGEFTPSLDYQNLIVHKDALKDDPDAEASCELYFENDGREYRLKRTISRSKKSFEIFNIDQNGVSKPLSNPDIFIQKLIPSSLSNWFFYDAEAIDSLSLEGGKTFKKGLQRALGLEAISQTVDDLDKCLNKKRKAASTLIGDIQIDETRKRIDSIERVLPGNREERDLAQKDYLDAESILKQCNEKLKGVEDISKLQKERENEKKEIIFLESKKEKVLDTLALLEGESFPSIFLIDKANQYSKNLKIIENKGKIPAPFNETLIDEILGNENLEGTRVCICSTHIKEGSKEEQALQSQRKIANTNTLNDRLRYMQYCVTTINSIAGDFIEKSQDLRDQAKDFASKIGDKEERINEIGELLANHDDKEVVALEKAQNEAQTDMAQKFSKYDKLKSLCLNLEVEQKQLIAKEAELQKRFGVSAKLKQDINKICAVKEYLEETLKNQQDEVLTILESTINDIFKIYLTKNYSVRIDPDTYGFTIYDDKDRMVPKSKGEGEVLKYAFISALIGLSSGKSERKIDFISEPITAPLVIDAPFTSLGDEYKSSTSINLSKAINQLMLLILPSSFITLQSELSDFVGKKYMIISELSGKQGKKPIRKHKVFNKELIFDEYDKNFDCARIEEL